MHFLSVNVCLIHAAWPAKPAWTGDSSVAWALGTSFLTFIFFDFDLLRVAPSE
jgi:hypothetical protein